jgi:uncharacterized protein (PEP-CTERM system associated)
MAATVISGVPSHLIRARYQILLAILLITISPEAISGNWQFLPRVGSSISYIDNINLAPDGNAVSSNVFELNPGFHLFGDGTKAKVNIDYHLQSLFYSNNPQKNGGQDSKYYHHLTSSANFEFVKQLLFFDANASVSQQASSAIGYGTVDNYSLSETRGTVRKYSLSPYLKHQFYNGINAELRYNYSDLSSDNRLIVDDSTVRTVSLGLDSGVLVNRWQWSAKAHKSIINYRTQADQTDYAADFGLSYHATPRTVVSLHGGNEIVSYQPAIIGETGGNYWLIGLDLKPARRTTVSLNAGKRYYGNTYGLSFKHTKRKSEIGIDYKEDITNSSFVQLQQQTIPLGTTGTNGDVLTPAFAVIDYPVLNTEVILRKSLLGHMVWQTGKSTLSIILSRTRFEFQNSNSSEDDKSGQASWKWLTTKNITFNLNGYRRYRKLLPTASTEDLGVIEIKLTDNLNPNAIAGFAASRINSNASDNALDYKVNRLTLSLDLKW